MHDYSIDKHPKEKVLFGLAFLAIVAAPAINDLILSFVELLHTKTLLASVTVTAVPIFGLFLGLFALFDRMLWRVEWLRRFLLVPDLNGVWICNGRTIKKAGSPAVYEWTAKITIKQSWSKILIALDSGSSKSVSTSASVALIDGIGYRLLYSYQSSPNVDQTGLERHDGTAELNFAFEGSSASGHYYTDQHRQTVGAMTLTKE